MVDCKNLQDRFRYITHFARAFLFHLRLFQGLICLPHPCYVWQSACWVWRWPSRTDTVPIRSTLYCIYMFYQCFCQVSVKFLSSFVILIRFRPLYHQIHHGIPLDMGHGPWWLQFQWPSLMGWAPALYSDTSCRAYCRCTKNQTPGQRFGSAFRTSPPWNIVEQARNRKYNI